MQSAWFRKSRFKSGKGKKVNVGGRGLGYRERPGLGSSDNQANAGSGMVPNSIADLIPKPVRTGPGTDRLSAMKAAFRNQYVNQVRVRRVDLNLIYLYVEMFIWVRNGQVSEQLRYVL
jgi:ATP-dependent RNA helicase DDX42